MNVYSAMTKKMPAAKRDAAILRFQILRQISPSETSGLRNAVGKVTGFDTRSIAVTLVIRDGVFGILFGTPSNNYDEEPLQSRWTVAVDRQETPDCLCILLGPYAAAPPFTE
jgi:hypothetical protein